MTAGQRPACNRGASTAASVLSLTPPSANLSTAETRLRQHHAGAHVLLVEDNEVNLELGIALLE